MDEAGLATLGQERSTAAPSPGWQCAIHTDYIPVTVAVQGPVTVAMTFRAKRHSMVSHSPSTILNYAFVHASTHQRTNSSSASLFLLLPDKKKESIISNHTCTSSQHAARPMLDRHGGDVPFGLGVPPTVPLPPGLTISLRNKQAPAPGIRSILKFRENEYEIARRRDRFFSQQDSPLSTPSASCCFLAARTADYSAASLRHGNPSW
ncbi:hypothetical protein VDGL01_07890 [Verticillium dahliae]